MDRQGVLTPEQEDWIIGLIFHIAKFNNKILQLVSKPLISLIIKGVDNYLLNKIKPDWKEDIIPVIDKAITGDVNGVRQLAVDFANKKVDIKYVSEDTEMEFVDSISRTIVTGAVVLTEYKKGLKDEKS